MPRADDEVLRQDPADELLSRELAPTVDRERTGLVELVVRRALLAVEDVVRGDMEQHGSGLTRCERQALRPERIDPERPLALGLAGIHASEGGEVHDRVGTERRHGPHHGVVVADVELLVVELGDDVMRGQLLEEGAPEPSPRAGDDELHAPTGRGSVTIGPVCASRSQAA